MDNSVNHGRDDAAGAQKAAEAVKVCNAQTSMV
jgi:hypothetical protein